MSKEKVFEEAQTLVISDKMKAKGWRQVSENRIEGEYHSSLGNFKGYVVRGWRRLEFYIENPPRKEIELTGHGYCFSYRGEGLFLVHFAITPEYLSQGVEGIEDLLEKAAELKKQQAEKR